MSMFASGKYPVRLDEEQRQRLGELTRTRQAPAAKVCHARILLLAAKGRPGGGRSDAQIGAGLDLHVNSVAKVRKRFVTEGETPALNRKARPQPPVPPDRVERPVAAVPGPAHRKQRGVGRRSGGVA